MIVLNDIDGILIRILIGAAGSFIGGLGVVLFVKLILWKTLKFDMFAAMIQSINTKGE